MFLKLAKTASKAPPVGTHYAFLFFGYNSIVTFTDDNGRLVRLLVNDELSLKRKRVKHLPFFNICYNKDGDIMRLRNVRDKSDLDNSIYLIKEPQQDKGKYDKVFGNKNPIHIEIGMGKGQFIMQMALVYPDINFIGIEKFSSVMIRAIQKIGDRNIPNLRLMLVDANNIEEVFENEIDTIYLNFSDPWPKKKHARRRLSSDVFLNKYDKIFKKEKKIVMKTDNLKLFEYSLQSLVDQGYTLTKVTMDLQDKDNIMTEYEERFRLLGKPIYQIKAVKK